MNPLIERAVEMCANDPVALKQIGEGLQSGLNRQMFLYMADAEVCRQQRNVAVEALENILVSSRWSGSPPIMPATVAREALEKVKALNL